MDTWLRRDRIRSTLIVGIATWMMIRVAEWSMLIVATSTRSGVEIAAILAAVQVPATFYAGYAFKIFQTTKSIP